MVAKKRGKTAKNNTKSRSTGNNSIDVKKTEHIPKLAELLKKNKFIVVLIWANYCGHCHTYKDQVWDKLLKNQGRKAGLASIHYDQLETTPPAIPKKVSGYPTVLFIGKNGLPMKFKDENTGEDSLEYPKSRDLTTMSNIVNSDDPESLLSNEHVQETPPLSSHAENLSSTTDAEDVLNAVNDDMPPSKSKLVVPNPLEDMLNSQDRRSKSKTIERGKMDSGKITSPYNKEGGGALYKTLLAMMKQTQTRSSKQKKSKQTRRAYK